MQENKADHETRLRELASKLFFTLKGQGSRFALSRDVDVPKLVRHDGLTLDEVEDILNTWKLRGHGVADAGLTLNGPTVYAPQTRGAELAHCSRQYSSASMIVIIRWVKAGSAGSGECIDRS